MSEPAAESLSGSPPWPGRAQVDNQGDKCTKKPNCTKMYQGTQSVPKCESTPPWWRWLYQGGISLPCPAAAEAVSSLQ